MVPSPSTYHQRISGSIEFLLRDFVKKNQLGEVFYAPLDVHLGEDVVQSDILFISKAHSKIITPYACAKVYAYWMVANYRQGYNIFAPNGILFNHESPRRGETFLSGKVTRAITAILAKRQEYLYLGNLEAKRDWGFVPEYVEFIYKMLQNNKPEDFVIGTGETHSVKEFVKEAFLMSVLTGKNMKD